MQSNRQPGPGPRYRLVIAHADRPRRASQLEALVRQELRAMMGRDDLLEVSSTLPPDTGADAATLIVVLGSRHCRTDEDVSRLVDEARDRLIAVLPTYEDGDTFPEVVPYSVAALNGVRWGDGGEVTKEVLRQLCVTETDRKLFLSYRRVDTSPLADQLRRALLDGGYEVFLDRFSVPPGADFQARLDAELADKVFVLLLESRSAVGSEWVEHEVAYARLHNLALLPLTTPDADPDGLFSVVDDAQRCRLEPPDYDGGNFGPAGRLTTDALDRVLAEVDRRHAKGLRLRREVLLFGVRDFLRQARFAVTPVTQWSLLAEHEDGRRGVFLVTPRAPQVKDLREVDLLRSRGDQGRTYGFLVHETFTLEPANAALVAWAAHDRPLQPVTVLSVPSLLAGWPA